VNELAVEWTSELDTRGCLSLGDARWCWLQQALRLPALSRVSRQETLDTLWRVLTVHAYQRRAARRGRYCKTSDKDQWQVLSLL
jgi:hypothetical protein